MVIVVDDYHTLLIMNYFSFFYLPQSYFQSFISHPFLYPLLNFLKPKNLQGGAENLFMILELQFVHAIIDKRTVLFQPFRTPS